MRTVRAPARGLSPGSPLGRSALSWGSPVRALRPSGRPPCATRAARKWSRYSGYTLVTADSPVIAAAARHGCVASWRSQRWHCPSEVVAAWAHPTGAQNARRGRRLALRPRPDSAAAAIPPAPFATPAAAARQGCVAMRPARCVSSEKQPAGVPIGGGTDSSHPVGSPRCQPIPVRPSESPSRSRHRQARAGGLFFRAKSGAPAARSVRGGVQIEAPQP